MKSALRLASTSVGWNNSFETVVVVAVAVVVAVVVVAAAAADSNPSQIR